MLSPQALSLYSEFKFWTPLISLGYGAFRGFTWIKEIRTKDLADMKEIVKRVELGLNDQTKAVVEELRQFRNDLVSIYVPQSARSRGVVKPRTRKK